MQDERRESYYRLMMKLVDLPRNTRSYDPQVSLVDVIKLMADELLLQRPNEKEIENERAARDRELQEQDARDARQRLREREE